MAECKQFICISCKHTIEAWSDSSAYFFDDTGTKKYVYHPDHDNLAKCTDYERKHICLECGKIFTVDSHKPTLCCPECESENFIDLYYLSGKTCPYCKDGTFENNLLFFCIS